MRKSKVKILIPAKINLTLDVYQGENGFHNLKSLVASVNLFDAITLYKRTDDKITLKERGIKAGCVVTKNNAYKCAEYLIKEYSLSGVDIVINKKIPVGAGLGGSSADIAGVILGIERLFNINVDRKKTADYLGSDVLYMLEGGFAILSGRGNEVEKLSLNKKLYLNIIDNEVLISAKDSYYSFDKLGLESSNSTIKAKEKLLNGEEFYKFLSNDLQEASISLEKKIEESLKLFSLAKAKLMTGSGSAVYGVYEDKRSRDKEFRAIKKQGYKVIKTEIL